MSEVKFKSYEATPAEKSLGIVTVIATGTFMLRYKMNAGKNGGSFPNAPSYKDSNGNYVSAIIPESNFMVEEINSCIKAGMAKELPRDSGFNTGYQNPLPINPYHSSPAEPTQEEIPF